MVNREESLAKFKFFLRKLQGILMVVASNRLGRSEDESDGEGETPKRIPDDVKKGQFAVTAIKDGKPHRFVMELECLANPEFLSILEQAEKEYGFKQEGVLAVPCQPEELQTIVDNRRRRRASTSW